MDHFPNRSLGSEEGGMGAWPIEIAGMSSPSTPLCPQRRWKVGGPQDGSPSGEATLWMLLPPLQFQSFLVLRRHSLGSESPGFDPASAHRDQGILYCPCCVGLIAMNTQPQPTLSPRRWTLTQTAVVPGDGNQGERCSGTGEQGVAPCPIMEVRAGDLGRDLKDKHGAAS